MRAAVRKRCDGVTLFADDGVGFAGVTERCVASKGAGDDVDDAIACLADAESCAGAQAIATAVPRTAALLRATGVLSSLPLGTSCLPEFVVVRGADEEAGRRSAPCTTAMLRAGAGAADDWRGAFDKCLGALFACGSPTGGTEACWARATHTCDGVFRKLTSVDPATATVDTACTSDKVPFTVLASGNGANVGALGMTCAAVGIGPLDDVADWRACVTRTAACQVADAMGLVYPHADALLARVGRARLPAFCPGFVAVPTPPTRCAPPWIPPPDGWPSRPATSAPVPCGAPRSTTDRA
jgi:hypothetical protein